MLDLLNLCEDDYAEFSKMIPGSTVVKFGGLHLLFEQMEINRVNFFFFTQIALKYGEGDIEYEFVTFPPNEDGHVYRHLQFGACTTWTAYGLFVEVFRTLITRSHNITMG